jgi:hypothetical protein
MAVSSQLCTPAPLPPRKSYIINRAGGWVGPRTGLDAVEKSRISAAAGNLNPDSLVLKLVTIHGSNIL